jgi:rare lipoprotein A
MRVIITLFMISLVGFTIGANEEKQLTPVMNDKIVSLDKHDALNDASIIDYIDRGNMIASWYGPRFHGRKTANGEIFDQMAFTAAHKKFKFGTLLRVTNPKNNKTVIVRINDRGPFIRGRQLDLSKAAAFELEILEKGVAKVKIDQVSLKGVNFPVITLN